MMLTNTVKYNLQEASAGLGLTGLTLFYVINPYILIYCCTVGQDNMLFASTAK